MAAGASLEEFLLPAIRGSSSSSSGRTCGRGAEEGAGVSFPELLLAEIAVEQVKSVITVLDEAGCKAVAGVMGTNQRDVSAKDRRIQQASVL